MSNWPEEIPIPNSIGEKSYFRNGRPCCAVGNLYSLGVWSTYPHPASVPTLYIGMKYEELYREICRILFPETKFSYVTTINDDLPAKNRRLLYLLTRAKLGYTEGMPKNVLKLLNNPKIKEIKV